MADSSTRWNLDGRCASREGPRRPLLGRGRPSTPIWLAMLKLAAAEGTTSHPARPFPLGGGRQGRMCTSGSWQGCHHFVLPPPERTHFACLFVAQRDANPWALVNKCRGDPDNVPPMPQPQSQRPNLRSPAPLEGGRAQTLPKKHAIKLFCLGGVNYSCVRTDNIPEHPPPSPSGWKGGPVRTG